MVEADSDENGSLYSQNNESDKYSAEYSDSSLSLYDKKGRRFEREVRNIELKFLNKE